MTRLVLFKEDYGDTLLCITDLDNEQLKQVITKCLENDENGVGQNLQEVSESLFNDGYVKELETSESYLELNDLEWYSIVSESYYGFCEIVSQKGQK